MITAEYASDGEPQALTEDVSSFVCCAEKVGDSKNKTARRGGEVFFQLAPVETLRQSLSCLFRHRPKKNIAERPVF